MAVAFSPTPASSSIHLLHPWPRLIKGLCVAPPAPIEVGTTNYPFIAAVVPSAQLCSPCPPLLSPSSKLKTKITFWFFPHETQSTCSDFCPHLVFRPSLVCCLFLWENIHNGRGLEAVGKITQEPASTQTAAPAPPASNKDIVFLSPFTC